MNERPAAAGKKRQMLMFASVGDQWMRLQLMWLQFEVVRGPVLIVWGRFGAGLGPFGPQAGVVSEGPCPLWPYLTATLYPATPAIQRRPRIPFEHLT